MNSEHSNMATSFNLLTATDVATSSSPIYIKKISTYSPFYQNYSSNSLISNREDDNNVIEYQQLYNRYIQCLSQLHESVEEVDALKRENESLHLTNAELSSRVASLLSRDRFLAEFNRLSVGGPSSPEPLLAATSPQPLSERNHMGERVTLPKSISVRSRGYLKMMGRGGRDVNNREKSTGQRSPENMTQRVCVPGAKTEQEPLEFDAYNQGMFKTELCNKWQETGACPYGENCQFAHGIKELRPVIRHPRYKTEVCSMVLVGDVCPYGHRCHFRHALTDQERLVALSPPPPPPPRPR